MCAYEPDENSFYRKFYYGYETVMIALDIEYEPLIADGIGTSEHLPDICKACPLRVPDFMKPVFQGNVEMKSPMVLVR